MEVDRWVTIQNPNVQHNGGIDYDYNLEGRNAHINGSSEFDNPYKFTSFEWREWHEGWLFEEELNESWEIE